MKTNRVYLAKTSLARGLDVEYVKSNILRIPGIEIVEYGGGYQASECVCVVIVAEPSTCSEENDEFVHVELGRLVGRTIEEFATNGTYGDDFTDHVFIYTHKSEASGDDIESTEPHMLPVSYLEETHTDEARAIVNVNASESLMGAVAELLGDIHNDWKAALRYPPADEKFAINPVASLEDRKGKKVSRAKRLAKAKAKPEVGYSGERNIGEYKSSAPSPDDNQEVVIRKFGGDYNKRNRFSK